MLTFFPILLFVAKSNEYITQAISKQAKKSHQPLSEAMRQGKFDSHNFL